MIMTLYYDSITYIYTFIKIAIKDFFLHLKPGQLLLKYHLQKSIHVRSYSKNTNKWPHFDLRRPLYCNPS